MPSAAGATSIAPSGATPRSASTICRLSIIPRGASPLGLPYTRSRAPLRRRPPIAWLTRSARSHPDLPAIHYSPRGFAPRTPLHALSRAASPAPSDRVAHSLCSFASRSAGYPLFTEGLRPSDSPTRALARRFAGALRSRGSLALLVRIPICRLSMERDARHARRFARQLGELLLIDLPLELDDAVDDGLGTRRAAGHQDVDRPDLVHALHQRVIVEHAADRTASASRHHA